MKSSNVTILINTIEKVKRFVNLITKVDGDIDICHGRFTVDAKSILGILSLDISKPVTLSFHVDIEKDVREAVNEFIV